MTQHPNHKRRRANQRGFDIPFVLTERDADAILAIANKRVITGLRNRCILEVMYRAGLRVSEVANIPTRSVILVGDDPRLEIRQAKYDRDRNVPIRRSTVELLEAWKEIRPSGPTFFNACHSQKGVGATTVGAKITTRSIQRMVAGYARRAGIEWAVTPHTFRHSYATDMLRMGFDIREVQTLLGHSDVSTTMIYTHVDQSNLARKIHNL